MRGQIIFGTCMAVLIVGIGCGHGVADRSQTPEQLTLYSIDGRDRPAESTKDGTEPKTAEKFLNYPVYGKIEVQDPAKRREIFDALKEGMAKSDGNLAKCFWPRHAIRTVENGKTVDYVVCFQCVQLEIRRDGKSETKGIPRTRKLCSTSI